ncbi:MAG: hypothetical protein ABJC67_00130, partial [Lentilitoribacter sp.]
MRLIFHLGTYKTGTSSFQDMLFNNRKILKKNNIIHPQTGITNEKKLGHRHTPLIMNFLSGKNDACPNALLDELNASKAKTAIISSEAWSHPLHLSHLTRLVAVLNEHGYRDCSGFLVLRNLTRYQVSHYREYTVNRNNSQTYREYLRKRSGTFDYLLLARSFRSIFGSRFYTLPFDTSNDITSDLLVAMGLGRVYNKMVQTPRSNVKSIGTLEVEAMRCANLMKRPKAEGLLALSSIISEDPTLETDLFTERFIGDTTNFTAAYRRNLRNIADWSERDI